MQKSFGNMLAEFRQNRKMRQSELATPAGLHPTDLSKIERGIRKPPRPKNTKRLIETLRLSPKEAAALLEAGGYSPSEIGTLQFDPTEYPETTPEQAEALLNGERGIWPAWQLDTSANITAANLLAYWLWGVIRDSGEDLKKDELLGQNVFDIYIRDENFGRIAMPGRQSDFWYTKLMVFKRMADELPAPTVNAFKARIFDNAVLCLVYEYGGLDLESEWSYNLKIQPFGTEFTTAYGQIYLEFEARVEQVKRGDQREGYIAVFQPLRQTIKIIEETYQLLQERFVGEGFVQHLSGQDMEIADPYPPFFPRIYHDLLWNIVEGNEAQFLLFGSTFANQHFFDMLLSARFQELSGQQGNELLFPALEQFIALTSPYQDETHRLHQQYDEVMKHLLKNSAFSKAVKQRWRDLTLEDTLVKPYEGNVAYKVHMRCPYTNTFQMGFDSIPAYQRSNPPRYRVVCVPDEETREETKASLVLMFIEDRNSKPEDIGTTPLHQLIWGLTVLRTMKEGIPKDKGETRWNPDDAFNRIRQAIEAEYLNSAQPPAIEELKLQLPVTALGMLTKCSPATKIHIRDMLLNFMQRAPFARDALNDRPEGEIDYSHSQNALVHLESEGEQKHNGTLRD